MSELKEKRVLILEDEVIVAADLEELLNEEGYVVRSAFTSTEGVELSRLYKPHLAICDIHLEYETDGVEFAKNLISLLPQTEIIFVTAFSHQKILEAASEANPLNYIVKPWNENQMKTTVRLAFNFIENKLKQRIVFESLSLTEYRILELIAKQKSSREIAEQLFIAEKTVRNHRYNISKKLNLPSDNNSLLKWAMMTLT